MDKIEYLSLPTTSRPTSPQPRKSSSSRRLACCSPLRAAVIVSALTLVGTTIYLLDLDDLPRRAYTPKPLSSDIILPLPPTPKYHIGLTESMGWMPSPSSADLGSEGEDVYRLDFEQSSEYYDALETFALDLPSSLHPNLLSSLTSHQRGSTSPSPPMIDHKMIHQTDKEPQSQFNRFSQLWRDKNAPDGWTTNFLDDAAAEEWVRGEFEGSPVEWTWDFLHRGVLKADFLRYLLPLIRGGVYSDVDTWPVRSIETWGQLKVEYLNISETHGPDWTDLIASRPAVIVGIDVDVHSHPTWHDSWPRPLGICQWTLSSAPWHPIMLDAARRVVERSKTVDEWESDEIRRLRQAGLSEAEAAEAGKEGRARVMSVMEWTGPGLFTDAVMALIEATSLLATPLAGIAFVTFTTLYALAKCLSYRSLHFRPAASVTSPPKVETRHKPMWFMTFEVAGRARVGER